MLEDFKNHPAVAPVIRGAKMVEHSGHMVPEGGYDMIPKYVFDGCLLAGEAAGLCMNMGYQVRGMDFAVASGQMAAKAAVEALDKGDVSEAGLSSYKEMMEASFVIQDLRTFSKWPHVMEGWGSMFADYPVMAREIFNAMFSVDGAPPEAAREADGAHYQEARPAQAGRRGQEGGACAVSKVCEITVNVDEALSVNKYEVDEEAPHIVLADDDGSEAYDEEFLKLVRVCPAALYKVDGDGAKSFDYAGCLECGTCRIACGGTIVEKWVNPGPTMGVEYRFG